MMTGTASSPHQIKNILLATTFSPAACMAFEAAVKLCLCSGAGLRILNVFEYADLTVPQLDGQMLELDTFYQDAECSMDKLIQEARHRGVNCEGSIANGIVHRAILEAASKEDAGLIVLATRAIHGFERLVFGSTAEAVLRKALCPVYTVGPQAASEDLQADSSHSVVIFATDFHEGTTEALHEAVSFAHLWKLPLHCIHVLPRRAEDGEHKGIIPVIITEALEHLAAQLDHEPTAPICSVTYGSEVSTAIVEYGRQHNAKLIVLGVRRASLAASHVPAHIAYRIITEAPCPVVTVALPWNAPRSVSADEALQVSAAIPAASFTLWPNRIAV